MTDIAAGKPAIGWRGWLYYDGACPFCVATLSRWEHVFHRRGFAFAPLQAGWVLERLGLRPGELPPEMKLELPDGTIRSGLEAWRTMARTVWWLRPLAMVTGWPALNSLAWRVYRWIAANRYCLGDVCAVPRRRRVPHHAATTFLELP